MHQLFNTKNLVSTMKSIIFLRCRYTDKEKMLMLFDRVIELAKSDVRLLQVELTALATKSDFMDNDCRKMLLQEVISRCPDVGCDKNYAYLKFKALCELGAAIHSPESKALISEAEAILPILEDDVFNVAICLKKSELLSYIKDPETMNTWIRDILSVLANPVETVDIDEYIEIASYLSYVKTDFIKQYTKEYDVVTILVELIKPYIVDTSKCHSLLQYSQCCENICRLTDDFTIIEEYCQRVFKVFYAFPHECKSFLNTLYFMSRMYMLLPNDIINDSRKISILQEIKKNEHTNCLYLDILQYVFDGKLISDCSIFDGDIEYIREQREKANLAYEMYCDGKHKEAEQVFTEVLNCKISSIEDAVRTNLGYMVRRNEAFSNHDFEKIMQPKKHLSGFDIMNMLLFYSARNQFENEEFIKAKDSLYELSEDEKTGVIEWWSRVEIVGEEESKLALSFFN